MQPYSYYSITVHVYEACHFANLCTVCGTNAADQQPCFEIVREQLSQLLKCYNIVSHEAPPMLIGRSAESLVAALYSVILPQPIVV